MKNKTGKADWGQIQVFTLKSRPSYFLFLFLWYIKRSFYFFLKNFVLIIKINKISTKKIFRINKTDEKDLAVKGRIVPYSQDVFSNLSLSAIKSVFCYL